MKTNFRERLTRYQCFIRPKVHFAPEFSFKCYHFFLKVLYVQGSVRLFWVFKGHERLQSPTQLRHTVTFQCVFMLMN